MNICFTTKYLLILNQSLAKHLENEIDKSCNSIFLEIRYLKSIHEKYVAWCTKNNDHKIDNRKGWLTIIYRHSTSKIMNLQAIKDNLHEELYDANEVFHSFISIPFYFMTQNGYLSLFPSAPEVYYATKAYRKCTLKRNCLAHTFNNTQTISNTKLKNKYSF